MYSSQSLGPAHPALGPRDRTQAQQHQPWQSLVGGRRQQHWPHTRSTSHPPFELLRNLPHSQEGLLPSFPFASPRAQPPAKVTIWGEGLTPFPLPPHTQLPVLQLRHSGCLSSGRLWDLRILYLGIIYCYFFLLLFH